MTTSPTSISPYRVNFSFPLAPPESVLSKAVQAFKNTLGAENAPDYIFMGDSAALNSSKIGLPTDLDLKANKIAQTILNGFAFLLTAYLTYYIMKEFQLTPELSPPKTFSSSLKLNLPSGVTHRSPEELANIKVSFDDIQGLGDIKSELQLALIPYTDSDRANKYNLSPVKGILLEGPPGTGKTSLAQAFAKKASVDFFSLSGATFCQSYVGQAKGAVQQLFRAAKKCPRAIIFIDEIDAFGGRNQEKASQTAKETVAELLNQLDGVDSDSNILVIGATNLISQLDPALIRPGRFDLQLAIPTPDEEARLDILKFYADRKKITEINRPIQTDETKELNLKTIAEQSGGFTAADLKAIIEKALYLACEVDTVVTNEHLIQALKYQKERRDTSPRFKTISSHSFTPLLPDEIKTSFNTLIGLENEKKQLTQIKESFLNPGSNASYHLPATKGILLKGPPGMGKTSLAQAFAKECGASFYSMNGSTFYDKYQGESTKSVRQLFQEAATQTKAIIFIDEIDSIGNKKGSAGSSMGLSARQIISELQTQIDCLPSNIIILAATNYADQLDPELIRSGRFDSHITIALPDKATRKSFLIREIEARPKVDGLNFETIATQTESFSSAELKALINQAASLACSVNAPICQNYLEIALEMILMQKNGPRSRFKVICDYFNKFLSFLCFQINFQASLKQINLNKKDKQKLQNI